MNVQKKSDSGAKIRVAVLCAAIGTGVPMPFLTSAAMAQSLPDAMVTFEYW